MDVGALLKRLGLLATAAALALLWIGPAAFAAAHAPTIAVYGVAAILIGFGLDITGLSRPRCKRCRRHVEAGSVFCPSHHRELADRARWATSHNRSDDRHW